MADKRKVNGITYTPDFIGKDEKWIIECKGWANESFPLRWKLFKNLMRKKSKPPIIFKPTNRKDCEQVVEYLIKKGFGNE